MEYNTFLSLVGFCLLFVGGMIYFKNDMPEKEDIIEELKEPLLLLFLYAEKKGWSGPDKMKWCLEQVLKIVPIHIDYLALEGIAQKLYDEYSNFIKENLE